SSERLNKQMVETVDAAYPLAFFIVFIIIGIEDSDAVELVKKLHRHPKFVHPNTPNYPREAVIFMPHGPQGKILARLIKEDIDDDCGTIIHNTTVIYDRAIKSKIPNLN
ncbi:hypothetical protein ACJX0J_018054, partial [Zea mays]